MFPKYQPIIPKLKIGWIMIENKFIFNCKFFLILTAVNEAVICNPVLLVYYK